MSSASPLRDLRVRGERLCLSLLELAQIGATKKGGVCRLALTDLDKQGRLWVVDKARRLGLEITTDQIGNTFMRRPGKNMQLAPIMTGSHIDTQPTGGKYDGNYGVLAGLEVIETLNDHGIETEAPIEVVFWTNEEGSRFTPVMMGSGVFAKVVSLEHAYEASDIAGKKVKEELQRIGFLGEQVPGEHPCGAYFEAHIEQGPVLENKDKVIGVVPAVMGLRWFDCTVQGFEAHAGPTPMDIRIDASDAPVDLDISDLDLALRYGPAASMPSHAQRLFGEQLTPVASPWLLKSQAPLQVGEDLQHFALIEASDAHRSANMTWLTWRRWLDTHGFTSTQPKRWLYFNYAYQMVQAALSGQGVVLARPPLITESLVNGDLVEVLPGHRTESPMAYWLLTHF